MTQAIEKAWRRVPESNRCTRICNPENSVDFKGKNCKRIRFVQGRLSMGYGRCVNAISPPVWQRKTAEGTAIHLNGIKKYFQEHPYVIRVVISTQMGVIS